MKRLLLAIILLTGFLELKSQENSVYQYYLLNPYLMNPALAGFSKQTEIRATLSQHWIGIPDAPSTQTLSAHSFAGKGMGVGGYFFNDKNGLNKETGVNLNCAYHINLGREDELLKIRKLSFGLGTSVFQHTINLSALTDHDYDPAVDGAEKSAFAINFNAGTYFRYDGISAGISVAGLGFKKLSIYDDATEPDFPEQLFTNAGYLFSPFNHILFEPSVVYKFSSSQQSQLDANLKAIFYQAADQQYWLSMSLRRTLDPGNEQFLDLIGLAGINYQGFMFAYAYDFGMSQLNSMHSGSHQIMLGILIKKAETHRISCPVY